MNTEKEPHVLVEYDYDPTVDTTFNLILNAAENGFDKKWTGKTVAEQLQAHHDEIIVNKYKEKKALLKKQINLKASTLIERQEGWRLEKAKQHVKQWSLKQISWATDSLIASDLKLRKYPL